MALEWSLICIIFLWWRCCISLPSSIALLFLWWCCCVSLLSRFAIWLLWSHFVCHLCCYFLLVLGPSQPLLFYCIFIKCSFLSQITFLPEPMVLVTIQIDSSLLNLNLDWHLVVLLLGFLSTISILEDACCNACSPSGKLLNMHVFVFKFKIIFGIEKINNIFDSSTQR